MPRDLLGKEGPLRLERGEPGPRGPAAAATACEVRRPRAASASPVALRRHPDVPRATAVAIRPAGRCGRRSAVWQACAGRWRDQLPIVRQRGEAGSRPAAEPARLAVAGQQRGRGQQHPRRVARPDRPAAARNRAARGVESRRWVPSNAAATNPSHSLTAAPADHRPNRTVVATRRRTTPPPRSGGTPPTPRASARDPTRAVAAARPRPVDQRPPIVQSGRCDLVEQHRPAVQPRIRGQRPSVAVSAAPPARRRGGPRRPGGRRPNARNGCAPGKREHGGIGRAGGE